MPRLTTEPKTKQPKKILMLGDSGAGKTGALISLALAGYNIYIADFDNQAEDVIRGILGDMLYKKTINQETHDSALGRFDIETLADKMKIVGTGVQILAATAWMNGMRQLSAWSTAGLDPACDVVVIDSLTFAAKAAANQYLAINKRLKEKEISWHDYGDVQDMIIELLSLLYLPAFSANVIVNTHVDIVETKVDSGKKDKKDNPIMNVVDTRALPMSIGKAIAPRIPQYFNSMLVARSEGKETARKRFIYTAPIGLVDTKTPYANLPRRLPIETGLADYFAAA